MVRFRTLSHISKLTSSPSAPATLYCNIEVQGGFVPEDLNPYDLRKPCDREKQLGDLCYDEMRWVDIWMNKDEVKKALGVAPDRHYQGE